MRVYYINYLQYAKSEPAQAVIVAKSVEGALTEFEKLLRKRHYISDLDAHTIEIKTGEYIHRVQR